MVMNIKLRFMNMKLRFVNMKLRFHKAARKGNDAASRSKIGYLRLFRDSKPRSALLCPAGKACRRPR
jgi:hypothetical protein